MFDLFPQRVGRQLSIPLGFGSCPSQHHAVDLLFVIISTVNITAPATMLHMGPMWGALVAVKPTFLGLCTHHHHHHHYQPKEERKKEPCVGSTLVSERRRRKIRDNQHFFSNVSTAIFRIREAFVSPSDCPCLRLPCLFLFFAFFFGIKLKYIYAWEGVRKQHRSEQRVSRGSHQWKEVLCF